MARGRQVAVGFLVGVAMVVATAGSVPAAVSAQAGDWPQFGFDAGHRWANPTETQLDRAHAPSVQLAWSADSRDLAEMTPPVVVGDRVVVGQGAKVLAFNLAGRRVWTNSTSSRQPAAPPAVLDGVVFVGDAGGDVERIDLASGAVLGAAHLGGSIVGALTVADGRVFAATTNGGLWRMTASGGSHLLATLPVGISTSPALAPGRIFVTAAGKLFALDRTDGHLLWQVPVGGGPLLRSPVVALGKVFVAADRLKAFTQSTGTHVWTSPNTIGAAVTMPAVGDGLLYLGAQDPDFGVFAVSALTGAIVWDQSNPGELFGNVVLAAGVVWSGSDGDAIEAINSGTGKLLGTVTDPTGYLNTSPVVANSAVFVVADNAGNGGTNHVDAFRLP